MKVSERQAEEIARLARLEFSSDEMKNFISGFEEMIAFCDGMGGDLQAETHRPARELDCLREDAVQNSLPADKLLSGAKSDNGFFVVKRVVK